MALTRRTALALAHAVGACASASLAGCVAPPYQEVHVDMRAPAQAVAPAVPSRPVLRLSVATMQAPADTFAIYSRLFARLGQLIGEDVRFVQRRTYGEVNDLLLSGQLDAALLCTGGFLDAEARGGGKVEVLAVPMIDGKTTYQSYVIVPAASGAARVSDLAGKRFAYTDELSLSGYLYPAHLLRELGHDPADFFASALFTRSHDRSVDAVGRGLVDGAAVDSLVFEALAVRDPTLRDRVRIVHRSPSFGVMPLVASTRMPAEDRAKLRTTLLELHRDPAAAAVLREIHIERFIAPEPALYAVAADIARRRK